MVDKDERKTRKIGLEELPKVRPTNYKAGSWELTVWPVDSTKRPNCSISRGRVDKKTGQWNNENSFKFYENEIERLAECIQKYYDETQNKRKE